MWCYNILLLTCFFRFIFLFGVVPFFYLFYVLAVETSKEEQSFLTFCFAVIGMSIVSALNVLLVLFNITVERRKYLWTNELDNKIKRISNWEIFIIVFFLICLLIFMLLPHENISFLFIGGIFFSGCFPLPFFALTDILLVLESMKHDGAKRR